jgi:hypothetical protein
MTEEEIALKLADKRWRISNLYSIKDAANGQIIKFEPRPEQLEVFEALLGGARKIIILKARRLGMSTAIDIFAADDIAFRAGIQWSIVDQNQDDASKKLNNIVKVALDSLPKPIKDRMKFHRSNDSSVELSTITGDTTSSLYAGKNARGGTNQGLHVSEWGVIQADDPARSEEILTGALPSAEHGITIVETTWKGGRGGHLWNLVKSATESMGKELTPNDWRLFFFAWWSDPTYTEEGDVNSIDKEVLDYLAEKEAELGIKFDDGQKCWYARRKQTYGLFMYREFPTTIDECFKSPIEGAIYADLLDKLRFKNAVKAYQVDETALVHTFWDLGSPINTVVWYVQLVGAEIRVVDCDRDLDLTIVQRASRILSKGYNLGAHYLPHDAMATDKSGKTFQSELHAVGLKNTRVVPRTQDIWIGINQLRQLMPRMVFRLPECQSGLEALENYHTVRETSSGIAKDLPVHDWSSHTADALRMFAEAQLAGMIEGGASVAAEGRRTARVGSGRVIVRGGFRGGRK